MTDDLRSLLEFALEVADEADAISLPAFLDRSRFELKADGSPVTAADRAIEELVRRRVGEAFPDDGVRGEEFGDTAPRPGGDGRRWIVDPIDATANFVRGTALWATLLAAEHGGELQVAVVSAPALGQRWHAVRGGGAATVQLGRKRPLRVSRVASLADAQLVYSGLAPLDREGRGAGVLAAIGQAWRDRGFGDFWGYMLVADGAAEAMFEVGVAEWDLAAPALIVEEAGGRFTTLDGGPGHAGPSALATNGLLHDALLELLAYRS